MNRNRQEKGITLIALVITIIVLLILAGVAIMTITGNEGILSKTVKAKDEQIHAEVKEQISLEYNAYQIDNYASNNEQEEKEIAEIASVNIMKLAETKTEETKTEKTITFWDYLLNKQYIDKKGKIDVEKLLGKESDIGSGTGRSNVYMLKVTDGKYVITYFGKETTAEPMEIWGIETSDIVYEYIDSAMFKTEMVEGNCMITGIKTNFYDTYTDRGKLYKTLYAEESKENLVKNLKIPYEIDGNPVVGIGAHAFEGCGNIIAVDIPETITSFGELAFAYCTKLSRITIPATVYSIGEDCFMNHSWGLEVLIKKGSSLSRESQNYPWGVAAYSSGEIIKFNQ